MFGCWVFFITQHPVQMENFMENILSLKNIVKIYQNGVIANKDVSIDIEKHTIHAIVGENGAGKSTLMKIIFGEEAPQEGEIYYKGKKVNIKNSLDAIKMGIGMVHQQLMLAPDLTVAENLILGIEPLRYGVFLDLKKIIELTEEASKKFGFKVPLNKKISNLSIGIRQRVEILKVLMRNAELIILDEPTSILTPQETEVLFKSLKDLKNHGKTIIFISHKLKEVKLIADKVTVMRDGKVISTNDASELDEHMIAHMMVGRKINFKRIPGVKKVGGPLFTVKNLNYLSEENIFVLKNINFEVRAGEILGVAGVEGNGQTELVEILTGLREATSGKIFIGKENISGFSPRKIREEMVAHIPEDRMKNGVAEHATIEENIIVDRYHKAHFSNKSMFLDWKYISKSSNDLIEKFKILTPSSKAALLSLSGGNIQKVVVARELSSNPQVIIAAQPTRGIDVGSEELIHNLLKDARDNGIATFLVSADLDEVLKLSTRIIVIYNGEIVARFDDIKNITQQDLSPYMLGVKKKGD